jgi:hypothetical protein
MVFDLDMIKKVYAEFPGKIAKAREGTWKTFNIKRKNSFHPPSS